jgi:hypothetical protein
MDIVWKNMDDKQYILINAWGDDDNSYDRHFSRLKFIEKEREEIEIKVPTYKDVEKDKRNAFYKLSYTYKDKPLRDGSVIDENYGKMIGKRTIISGLIRIDIGVTSKRSVLHYKVRCSCGRIDIVDKRYLLVMNKSKQCEDCSIEEKREIGRKIFLKKLVDKVK